MPYWPSSKGVKIIECDLTDYAEMYLEWSHRIYAKSKMKSPLSRPVFTGMLNALARDDHLLTLRAEVDGNVIGMYIVGHYDKTAYSINIVSDPAFRRYSPNNMIIVHALLAPSVG